MAIEIAIETPLQDDVRAMVAELNDYLIPLTPREFQFQLTVEQMAEPTVTLFVARDGGRAVGMGALKDHGDGLGEVKRMFTCRSAGPAGRPTAAAHRGAGARKGDHAPGPGDGRGARLRAGLARL